MIDTSHEPLISLFTAVDVAVQGVFGDAEVFGDFVAGLGDQQSPAVVEELDGFDLVFPGHERDGLTDLSRRFFDEFVQEVRDVLRNRADLFFFGSDGDERLDGIFNHHQFRNVVVDGEDADDFLIFIADIDGRRFEDAAVFSLGQVTRMVLEFVGLAAQGIEDGHGRAIADFAVGDVAVFNGYNGIFFVIIAQVMDDDFTVRAELVSQAFGQMA